MMGYLSPKAQGVPPVAKKWTETGEGGRRPMIMDGATSVTTHTHVSSYHTWDFFFCIITKKLIGNVLRPAKWLKQVKALVVNLN